MWRMERRVCEMGKKWRWERERKGIEKASAQEERNEKERKKVILWMKKDYLEERGQ